MSKQQNPYQNIKSRKKLYKDNEAPWSASAGTNPLQKSDIKILREQKPGWQGANSFPTAISMGTSLLFQHTRPETRLLWILDMFPMADTPHCKFQMAGELGEFLIAFSGPIASISLLGAHLMVILMKFA